MGLSWVLIITIKELHHSLFTKPPQIQFVVMVCRIRKKKTSLYTCPSTEVCDLILWRSKLLQKVCKTRAQFGSGVSTAQPETLWASPPRSDATLSFSGSCVFTLHFCFTSSRRMPDLRSLMLFFSFIRSLDSHSVFFFVFLFFSLSVYLFSADRND